MASWEEIRVVSACSPPPTDSAIFFPTNVAFPRGRRLLVEGGATSRMMKPGVRTDAGDAACVSGATLAAFGGHNAKVRYRALSLAGVLRRDRWLVSQFVVSVLTLFATVITAYLTFIKNNAANAGDVANQAAFWLLSSATVVAILKFLKEYREL